MNDVDTDLNNKIINGKSGEMTASRNSFHSVANEIISDPNQKIREGRLPTQNQISKRRTVLGQKPEYTTEKPISKRNSIDADLLKIQKIVVICARNSFLQNFWPLQIKTKNPVWWKVPIWMISAIIVPDYRPFPSLVLKVLYVKPN